MIELEHDSEIFESRILGDGRLSESEEEEEEEEERRKRKSQ